MVESITNSPFLSFFYSETLSLLDNALSGTIPSELGSLSSLGTKYCWSLVSVAFCIVESINDLTLLVVFRFRAVDSPK